MSIPGGICKPSGEQVTKMAVEVFSFSFLDKCIDFFGGCSYFIYIPQPFPLQGAPPPLRESHHIVPHAAQLPKFEGFFLML